MKTVVFAEDYKPIRLAGVLTLMGMGYDAVGAEDGQAALEKIAALDSVDLLVTDIDMPRMSGYGLIEELQSKGYGFPVIVHSTGFKPERVSYDGSLHFVPKFRSVDELFGLVEKVLGE